ncbi:hypothetical protein [Amycolatopsis albispora]|uniref:Asp23/Gls24 family envelope stress response protein n=1 Tax=Amycolatopsis albispora TaxID=1804986 RepID=A0A344L5Z4_9PSEU|nr:hypothetical protein [Amycolatopsis albispora]AXB43468.1 hypothetical protein A4R43_13695 [Amycolatopsis albispora]
MTSAASGSGRPGTLADEIASAVLAHPSVVRLAGGAGGPSTHLPGRRVAGVRADGPGIEVAVVLRLDGPLPGLGAELRERVRRVAGNVPVDIEITDVIPTQGAKEE